jgi:hypothetical protein
MAIASAVTMAAAIRVRVECVVVIASIPIAGRAFERFALVLGLVR